MRGIFKRGVLSSLHVGEVLTRFLSSIDALLPFRMVRVVMVLVDSGHDL